MRDTFNSVPITVTVEFPSIEASAPLPAAKTVPLTVAFFRVVKEFPFIIATSFAPFCSIP